MLLNNLFLFFLIAIVNDSQNDKHLILLKPQDQVITNVENTEDKENKDQEDQEPQTRTENEENKIFITRLLEELQKKEIFQEKTLEAQIAPKDSELSIADINNNHFGAQDQYLAENHGYSASTYIWGILVAIGAILGLTILESGWETE